MILYQLHSALKDLRSTILRSLVFIGQIVVASLTLAVTLGFLLSSLADLSVSSRLSERQVSYFNLYYDGDTPPANSEALISFLADQLDDSDTDYSLVVNNFDAGASSAGGLVIAATPGFARLYGFFDGDIGQGVALVGSKVTAYQVGDRIPAAGSSYEVVGRLPFGGNYLDPWSGTKVLDQMTVLLLPVNTIVSSPGSEHAFEELVGRTILVDPSDQSIERYVATVQTTSGLTVIPELLLDRTASVYTSHLRNAIAYSLLFSFGLAFILFGIGSSLAAMTRRNLKNYAIMRLSGARLQDIGLRLQWYLLIVFVFPSLFAFGVAGAVVPMLAQVLPLATVLIVLADACVSFNALSIIRRSSISELLNRRE